MKALAAQSSQWIAYPCGLFTVVSGYGKSNSVNGKNLLSHQSPDLPYIAAFGPPKQISAIRITDV
jgi:hypothetical protein